MKGRSARVCEAQPCEIHVNLGRQFCYEHNRRNQRLGSPHLVRASRNMPNEERLKRHGWTVLSNGCWEWNGADDGHGYGAITINYRVVKAHRVAYETWVGPIAPDACIRHTCDYPLCINPDHLIPGTHLQNMRDMVERGRSSRGETSGLNKLTESQVRQIRLEYQGGAWSQRDLAERFGVSQSAISVIVRRQAWRHVA